MGTISHRLLLLSLFTALPTWSVLAEHGSVSARAPIQGMQDRGALSPKTQSPAPGRTDAAADKRNAFMQEPIQITWTVNKSANGQSLNVDYTVHNESQSPVYLLDELVETTAQGLRRLPKAVIVMKDTQPGTVRLMRGYIRPEADVLLDFAPAARLLAAGQSITGHAEVALPLHAWHPSFRPLPLTAQLDAAVLEIGYLTAAPELGGPPVEGKQNTPSLASVVKQQRFARSIPIRLP